MKRRRERQPENAPATARSGRVEAVGLGIIVVLHLVLGLLYWHYTPYTLPPDEGAHGAYVRGLATEHKLSRFAGYDPENYETHQPPLYYALGVPFYLAAKAIGVSEPALGVRALSLILGALAILVTYGTVRNAYPEERRLALGCAGFVAFLPMHLVLSSAVSNDILAELVFGTALLLAGRMLVRGLSRTDTLLLGATLGIGLLTKTTCVLLFPAAVLVYLLVWQRGAKAGTAAGHLGAALGVAVVIGGWWLVRNTILYHDPLAMSAFNRAFSHTATPQYWLSQGWSWGDYFLLVGGWSFASFWGVFGPMKVFMPLWVYIGLGVLTLAAIIGSFRAVSALRSRSVHSRDVLLVYGATLALVFLAFIKFNTSFFQAQGRYLYPALVPVSVLWVLGFRQLFPPRAREYAPPAIAAGLLVLAVWALVTYVAPVLPYLS